MTKTRRARILVIDDDRSIRESLVIALEEEGYAIDTAGTGEEATEKSKARLYDLALIDIRLPDMSGTELLTAMRETVPEMVKIIITGYPSLGNAIEAVNRGANGYVVKPFRTEELVATIKEHLRKREETKEYMLQKMRGYAKSRDRELRTEAHQRLPDK